MGGGSGRRSREDGAPTDRVHGAVVNEGWGCDGRHRPGTTEGGQHTATALAARDRGGESEGPVGRLPCGTARDVGPIGR
jgi:hypothetical protein